MYVYMYIYFMPVFSLNYIYGHINNSISDQSRSETESICVGRWPGH